MFTINSADLYRVTKEAELFAGKGTVLPALAAVKYEVTEHGLIVTSTDRFMVGFNRVAIDQDAVTDDTGLVFFLAPPDRKSLLAWLAPLKTARNSTPVMVHYCDGTVEVSDYDGNRVRVATADVQYPNVAHVIPSNDVLEGDVSSVVSIDARKLALFAKVKNSFNAVFMRNTAKERAPIVVRIGDDFIGMVMPTRMGSRETKLPAWLSR